MQPSGELDPLKSKDGRIERLGDDSMRCILLKKAAEADWMIDNKIMNSGLCNGFN